VSHPPVKSVLFFVVQEPPSCTVFCNAGGGTDGFGLTLHALSLQMSPYWQSPSVSQTCPITVGCAVGVVSQAPSPKQANVGVITD